MEIDTMHVATIYYTLTDDAGEVIDQSPPQSPLVYLHGAGGIVPGLEKALAGKRPGDSIQADLAPEEAFGPRHAEMIQTVPRDAFPEVEVKPGMQFEARTEHGPLLVTVTEVNADNVVVDGNHPLAGRHLHFAVEVADVRAATEAEKAQGAVVQGA